VTDPTDVPIGLGVSLPADVPIVLAASAGWATPAPVNAHQVARRLAARGHRVLFVESVGLRAPAPLASGHDLRRILARLRGFAAGVREVEPRLFVLSPPWPMAGPRRLRELALALVARGAARAARRLGFEAPILWAFLPTALPMARRLGARLVVYHCVDHYAANPGVDAGFVDAFEDRMLARADVVFATSASLAERLRPRAPRGVALVPNGADVALFARAHEALPEPPELAGLPRPRAIYVGNLAAYRVDPALLAAVAKSGASIVLVGPVGLGDAATASPALDALLGEAPVRAVGARPPEALPALLRHCDVALIPFLDNAHTRASLPLKLWEYLAAGLPVVATPLPNLVPLAERGLATLAAGPDAFASAVHAAAADAPGRRAERLVSARAHDWPERMETLCGAVGAALASRGAAPNLPRGGSPPASGGEASPQREGR
jgi:glycosyltransferase involved in cell wall biosynthesis